MMSKFSKDVNARKLTVSNVSNQTVDSVAEVLRTALTVCDDNGPANQAVTDHPLASAFCSFIEANEFPCVGAKAALTRQQITIVIARDITSTWDDLRIYPLLRAFAQSYKSHPSLFRSFAVIFEAPTTLEEEAFEDHLWRRLQSLTDKDGWVGHTGDPRVSDNPDNPHFSLSFGGEAFFVVGLHPNATRPARRFQAPALIFNLHDQFELLRESGIYEKLRKTILKRDLAIAGSINPMLSRFGENSEAKQYSGRIVPEDWVCPFTGRSFEVSHDDA